jgi:beta-aspartyl-dipeptidase (metallo-type)
MLDSGLALQQVLPMMTSNVASLLKLRSKGRIAKGMDADLLVLNDLDEIDSVMVNGRWHISQGKILIKGIFEE